MGPIRYKLDRNELFKLGEVLKPQVRVVHTNLYDPAIESYQDLLKAVTQDPERNRLIMRHIQQEAEKGFSCLALSERIGHAKELLELFRSNSTVPAATLTGKDSNETRKRVLDGMNEGTLRVLFATRLADEGLDVKRLSRLFLTCPIRSTNKLTQQIGRIQRSFNGKSDAVVYDFCDDLVGLAKSQFLTRKTKVYETYELEDLYPYAR
jgi:superfamily II DNA or RNA helicase